MYYENSYKRDNIRCLESHRFQEIPYSDNDEYITVSKSVENRLDIISFNYYNTVNYWWIIALANNINNPLNVPEGTQLRLPSLSTIWTLKGV